MIGGATMGDPQYVPSRFNVFKTLGDRYFVSNTLTRCLIELDEDHYRLLASDSPAVSMGEEDKTLLVDEGVLVERDLDEVGLLRFWRGRGRFSKDMAEIAIAPTMACNFACPYCFESRRAGRMAEEVQDALVEHVGSLMDDGIRAIHVSWYGGEPLLYPDIVSRVSRMITDRSKATGVPVFYSMTTNGYLLDNENVEMLVKCGINEVQVTLDGSRDSHDSHRYLADGGGTFDRIIANIDSLAEKGIRVTLRVNVDMSNPDAFAEVKEYIESHGIDVSHVYPAIIEQTSNQSEEQRARCYSHRDHEEVFQGEVLDYYLKDGYDSMRLVACNCGAEHAYSCVVDELGYLYKCWNDVGKVDRAFASLIDDGFENPSIQARYLGREPSSEEECSSCPYLPICLGGCLWEYLDKGSHACCAEKQLYWDILLSEYAGGGEEDEGVA